MRTILDFKREEKGARGNGVGDPAVLVDRRTGDILVAALWSRGNRAWHGSGPGLAPEETGQLIVTRSRDDGLTWTKPLNITRKIAGRDPRCRLLFIGPGARIQLRDGTLVFPAQLREAAGTPRACFIFSSDGGEERTISPPALPAGPTRQRGADRPETERMRLLHGAGDEPRIAVVAGAGAVRAVTVRAPVAPRRAAAGQAAGAGWPRRLLTRRCRGERGGHPPPRSWSHGLLWQM